MNVGFKIKKLRENRKMSQPELAEHLGISQTSLSNIENGKTKKLDFCLMIKICKELGVQLDYFIEDIVTEIQKKETKFAGYSYSIIDLSPENLFEQLKLLIIDNKEKEDRIRELESKLNL